MFVFPGLPNRPDQKYSTTTWSVSELGIRPESTWRVKSVFPLRLPGDGNWYDVDLATNSFGQGLAVTPIQLASAVSAAANGGKIMTPHVVKSVISNGRQYNTSIQVLSQPISEQTAHTLTEMLAVSLEIRIIRRTDRRLSGSRENRNCRNSNSLGLLSRTNQCLVRGLGSDG